MKVSKLFHWLYASLMLMPLFAIGVTCLVNVFNNTDQQETTINYKYKTNDVESDEDLIIGNIYTFNTDSPFMESVYIRKVVHFNNVDIDTDDAMVFLNQSTFTYLNEYSFLYEGGDLLISTGFLPNNSSLKDFSNYTSINDLSNINFDFVYTSEDRFTFDGYITISKCQNIPIESVETHGINRNDIFYKSIEKVENSNLFNWAQDSFLVVPFNYILNLFSVPQTTIFSLLLSYWLSISIIWLVFDLIMYVPLLVHSWIDRGVIQ